VEFLVNDRSLAGQFPDVPSFQNAVTQMMLIRREIERLGSSLYCHRNLADAQVIRETGMRVAVQSLPVSERRVWMQWLTTLGPYWEDARLHNPDDWLEVNGNIVTDTAVGEAAICRLRGLARELVSFAPSDWLFTPVDVNWRHDQTSSVTVSVPNHWELATIRASLAANPPPIDSWTRLATHSVRAFAQLSFAANAFQPLDGHPFVRSAAERIQVLLHTLNRLKGCFDEYKQRTREGHAIYNDFFTGPRALFSDSSVAEKNEFEDDLSFPHPENPAAKLFCTWHGKVNTPKLRIHFSWPISADAPLYIVYVGPKITKR